MSADQSPEATAALPRVAVPPCSQYPVSWIKHRGIEEGIGNSELVKSIDDNTNRKTTKKHFEKKSWGRCIDASTD
jgi:hypothetical protein